MDKETLSNYGWIVICVLVLAVMLALATPFGTFVADAIKSTTQGLFDVNQNALDAAGITIDGQEFDVPDMNGGSNNASSAVDHNGATIPEGATYTKADGTILNAGDAFPETITNGDIYTYENYKYTYNLEYMVLFNTFMPNGTYDGWYVSVTDKTLTEYGEILESINNKSIKSMNRTFYCCESMTTAPQIPSTVTNMENTFYGCSSLFDVSNLTIPTGVTSLTNTFQACKALTDLSNLTIPNSVVSMNFTFWGCTSMTKAPIIPSSVNSISTCFANCTALTSITIDSTPTNYSNAFKDSSIYSIRMSDGTAHPMEAEMLAASGKSNPWA